MLARGLSDWIGDLYAGAEEPGSWRQQMDRLVGLLDVRLAIASTLDPDGGFSRPPVFAGDVTARTVDAIHAYFADIYRQDPGIPFACDRPQLASFGSHDYIPHDSYFTHPMVKWTRGTVGTSFWRIAMAEIDGKRFGLAVHRMADEGPLPSRGIAMLELAFAHLKRVVARPAHWVEPSSQSEALVWIDGSGRVCAMTPAAERLLTAKDGLAVLDHRLTALRTSDAARIAAQIEHILRSAAAGNLPRGMQVPRPSGRRAYALTFEPLRRPPDILAAFRAVLQVRMIDPDAAAPAPPERLLRDIYGLTAREAQLAIGLTTQQDDLRATAEAMNIQYESARGYLKRIMRKTETSSQSGLTRLILRLTS